MNEKQRYEIIRSDKLISLIGAELYFDRFGDPNKNEPDVIYGDKKGKLLGVEVGTAYFSEYQAMQYWSILRRGWGGKKFIDLLETSGPHSADCEFDSIQSIINDKCKKTHSYDGVTIKWLLVWDDTLFTDRDDILCIIKRLNVPKNNFQKIFIVSYTSDSNNFKFFMLR